MDLQNNDGQLRRQVYEYLRDQISQGMWKTRFSIKTGQIIKELGISKTPLRDALIRLEAEGFVTILPQRGVIINVPTLEDVQLICEVLGGLESKVIISVFPKIGAREIAEFKRLNEKMLALADLNRGDFKDYIDCNLLFHDVFLNLSENQILLKHIRILKQRMYDFPKRDYGSNWQHRNFTEHQQFIQLIEGGDAKGAADFMRDVHWFLPNPEAPYENLAEESRDSEGGSSLDIRNAQ